MTQYGTTTAREVASRNDAPNPPPLEAAGERELFMTIGELTQQTSGQSGLAHKALVVLITLVLCAAVFGLLYLSVAAFD